MIFLSKFLKQLETKSCLGVLDSYFKVAPNASILNDLINWRLQCEDESYIKLTGREKSSEILSRVIQYLDLYPQFIYHCWEERFASKLGGKLNLTQRHIYTDPFYFLKNVLLDMFLFSSLMTMKGENKGLEWDPVRIGQQCSSFLFCTFFENLLEDMNESIVESGQVDIDKNQTYTIQIYSTGGKDPYSLILITREDTGIIFSIKEGEYKLYWKEDSFENIRNYLLDRSDVKIFEKLTGIHTKDSTQSVDHIAIRKWGKFQPFPLSDLGTVSIGIMKIIKNKKDKNTFYHAVVMKLHLAFTISKADEKADRVGNSFKEFFGCYSI